MTIEQAAIEHRLGKVTEYMDPALQKKVQRELDMFKAGAQWAIEKSLDILDDMFICNIAIMGDEWRNDDKIAVQGRNYFRKKMEE